MTYAILAVMFATWFLVQGAGFDQQALAASVCNLGMVPGELTHMAPLGAGVPLGRGMACIVDNDPINAVTPFTSMFLHGGWGHLLGNALFFWVFGNNIEDSLGHFRFLVFYLACGVLAGITHIIVNANSPIPSIGASGAIAGVLAAYLRLFPHAQVRTLIFLGPIVLVPRIAAAFLIIFWFATQFFAGISSLGATTEQTSGVAVWAHIGGFVAGLLLVEVLRRRDRQPALSY
jgi:membrane associated rhomboid family serine protease